MNILLGFIIGVLGVSLWKCNSVRVQAIDGLEKAVALIKKMTEYEEVLQMKIGELKDKEKYGK